MKITHIDHQVEQRNEWDEFVLSHRESTNYHLQGWRDVIEKSFGHRTYYLSARNRQNEITGVLPLVHMKSTLFGSFLVSLPFFNYGGLLCNGDDAAAELLDSARELSGKLGADHVELRHLRACNGGLATREHKVTMILPLEADRDSQWKDLDSKVRNQVRKARKGGLQAITGHAELLDDFYTVFCRNMRDLGTPVYGRRFFQNILASFPESTRIISVSLQGKPVAAALLTWYRDTLEVPWASSVREYREHCPNNLLYWEAICFAIDNGLKKLDFGRSTPGEGTYCFKKQWGAVPKQLYWQYVLNNGGAVPQLSPANSKYRTAIRVWQSLPVFLTNILGPAIVRNIP